MCIKMFYREDGAFWGCIFSVGGCRIMYMYDIRYVLSFRTYLPRLDVPLRKLSKYERQVPPSQGLDKM